MIDEQTIATAREDEIATGMLLLFEIQSFWSTSSSAALRMCNFNTVMMVITFCILVFAGQLEQSSKQQPEYEYNNNQDNKNKNVEGYCYNEIRVITEIQSEYRIAEIADDELRDLDSSDIIQRLTETQKF